MTKNLSGPENRPPLLPLKHCGNFALVDDFIKDGWVDPAKREQEVISLYQGQIAAERREHLVWRDRIEAKVYADSWIERWLEDVT
ncbi:MAG: hypothetical protein ACRCT6_13095 [Notoacmeibacter sp.]